MRRVLAGEFVQVNRQLLRDLIERDLWTEDTRLQLMTHNGSVQLLPVPVELKELYKTVWEIKQRIVLDIAADRGKPQGFYDRDRKKLGEGSCGSVFKAMNGGANATRAVESIAKEQTKNLELFKPEMAIMKIIDHPNVI